MALGRSARSAFRPATSSRYAPVMVNASICSGVNGAKLLSSYASAPSPKASASSARVSTGSAASAPAASATGETSAAVA